MNKDENTRGTKRYVALDIHKHYCVVAGVDREDEYCSLPYEWNMQTWKAG